MKDETLLQSRENFISLCNKFWNWQELDEITSGEEEPRLEWNGHEFTHRVTQALWRMYQAALQSGNSAQPVTVPAGYVLVPVEPTDLMVEAMYRHQLSMRGALKAAISAAPKGV